MAVAPGFVATEMAARVLAAPEGDAIRALSPFDRVARPEEIAETIAWLATAAPERLSGAIVDANGASYLRLLPVHSGLESEAVSTLRLQGGR